LFGKTPLKAQNDYIFQKFCGAWPLWPPWLRLWPKLMWRRDYATYNVEFVAAVEERI